MSSPMMGGWETLRALRKEGDLAGHQVARGTARRIMAFARPYRRDISVFLVTVVSRLVSLYTGTKRSLDAASSSEPPPEPPAE